MVVGFVVAETRVAKTGVVKITVVEIEVTGTGQEISIARRGQAGRCQLFCSTRFST